MQDAHDQDIAVRRRVVDDEVRLKAMDAQRRLEFVAQPRRPWVLGEKLEGADQAVAAMAFSMPNVSTV